MASFFTAFLLMMLLATQVVAQTFTVTEISQMIIDGSANVSDWEARVETIDGKVLIRKSDQADWVEADPSWFERVEIRIPVEDIDTDSRRMRNNMHGYLKKNQYPVITYRLMEVTEVVEAGDSELLLTARGLITVAGVDKEIVHDVLIRTDNSAGLAVSGSQDLKMTDFGIDPPTALLGVIRTRDEVTIAFELYLEQGN